MKRRALLGSLPAALFGTAGCLGRSAGPPEPYLDYLWFVNHADDGCDVTVEVVEGEETRYETSFRLGPSTPDPEHPSNVTRDPGLGDPGAYVVRATVGDDTADIDVAEWVDGDEDCVLAKFERSTTGTLFARPRSYQNC